MAVKEEDGWRQVPFCLPVRTGIVLMSGTCESSGKSEVMSLMNHAEVCLRIKLPSSHLFRMSWYQGIEGFTGWHAGAPLFVILRIPSRSDDQPRACFSVVSALPACDDTLCAQGGGCLIDGVDFAAVTEDMPSTAAAAYHPYHI
jgi:hypothetical protein